MASGLRARGLEVEVTEAGELSQPEEPAAVPKGAGAQSTQGSGFWGSPLSPSVEPCDLDESPEWSVCPGTPPEPVSGSPTWSWALEPGCSQGLAVPCQGHSLQAWVARWGV